MEMNKELLAKAKTAKSPEELIGIAKENGMELTEESAKAYFELLKPKTGEMADEELENVSGGACYKNGQMVVTVALVCTSYECKKCGGGALDSSLATVCNKCGKIACCDSCKYCVYKKGLWLCTNEKNRKN